MKTPSHRSFIPSTRGFTLVELLVVIAIIAVLAAAGFGAGRATIERSKRMTALAAIQGLNQSIGDFYTEYGTFPIKTPPSTDNSNNPIRTDKSDGVSILEELLGYKDPNSTDTINTKAVKYLNVKQSKDSSSIKNPKDGLVLGRMSGTIPQVRGLYDPWGGPYNMVFDFDFDDNLHVRASAANSDTTLYGRKFAAWSDGADWKQRKSKVGDDVYSWK